MTPARNASAAHVFLPLLSPAAACDATSGGDASGGLPARGGRRRNARRLEGARRLGVRRSASPAGRNARLARLGVASCVGRGSALAGGKRPRYRRRPGRHGTDVHPGCARPVAGRCLPRSQRTAPTGTSADPVIVPLARLRIGPPTPGGPAARAAAGRNLRRRGRLGETDWRSERGPRHARRRGARSRRRLVRHVGDAPAVARRLTSTSAGTCRAERLLQLVLRLGLALVVVHRHAEAHAGGDPRREQCRLSGLSVTRPPPWNDAPAPIRTGSAAALRTTSAPPIQ